MAFPIAGLIGGGLSLLGGLSGRSKAKAQERAEIAERNARNLAIDEKSSARANLMKSLFGAYGLEKLFPAEYFSPGAASRRGRLRAGSSSVAPASQAPGWLDIFSNVAGSALGAELGQRRDRQTRPVGPGTDPRTGEDSWLFNERGKLPFQGSYSAPGEVHLGVGGLEEDERA